MSDTNFILTYEEQLRQAQLAGDVSALDRLLDDALIFTALDGSVVGKADDLNMHRSGQLSITRMNPIERRMLQLGTTIVVVTAMDAEAIVDGNTFNQKLRYTRVWRAA